MKCGIGWSRTSTFTNMSSARGLDCLAIMTYVSVFLCESPTSDDFYLLIYCNFDEVFNVYVMF